jgi:hypothetical protein
MQYQVNLKQSEEGYAVHSKSTNWVLGFIVDVVGDEHFILIEY